MGIEEVKSFVESKFELDYGRNKALKGFSPRLMMLHSEQVAKLALKIGQMEGASLDVLETAALLHDASTYEKVPSGRRSEVLSAETAEHFLRNKGYPSDFVETVVDAILSCGWEPVKEPTTVEQKSLADADVLQHLGPMGVIVLATFYVSQGKSNNAIAQILSQITQGLQLRTNTGKKIFVERKEFLQDFVQSFRREIDGTL